MGKQRKPAGLKQGKSENKAQLAAREEMEKQLMGNSDDVNVIPEYLTDEEKILADKVMKTHRDSLSPGEEEDEDTESEEY